MEATPFKDLPKEIQTAVAEAREALKAGERKKARDLLRVVIKHHTARGMEICDEIAETYGTLVGLEALAGE